MVQTTPSKTKAICGLSLATTCLITACGCVLFQNPDNAVDSPQREVTTGEDSTPRVALDWQKKMLAIYRDKGASEAWALFSEGGWSDAGQVMVFHLGDGSKYLVTANAAAKDVTHQRKLGDQEWNQLSDVINSATSLRDIDVTAFDALIYEYVHIAKGETKKRLFIRNPGKKPMPSHDRLIAQFRGLLNSP